MNQDDKAIDAFDAALSRLFAEKNEPLSGNEFVAQLLPRIEQAHRAKQLRRVFLLIVVLTLSAILAPMMVQITTGLVSLPDKLEVTSAVNSVLMPGMLLVALAIVLRNRKRFS